MKCGNLEVISLCKITALFIQSVFEHWLCAKIVLGLMETAANKTERNSMLPELTLWDYWRVSSPAFSPDIALCLSSSIDFSEAPWPGKGKRVRPCSCEGFRVPDCSLLVVFTQMERDGNLYSRMDILGDHLLLFTHFEWNGVQWDTMGDKKTEKPSSLPYHPHPRKKKKILKEGF